MGLLRYAHNILEEDKSGPYPQRSRNYPTAIYPFYPTNMKCKMLSSHCGQGPEP